MGPGHIRGLDGLRAAAALIVFVYHVWERLGYPPVIIGAFGPVLDLERAFLFGPQGVSLFFVLSGFLLSQPFWGETLGEGRPVDVAHYLKRRFLRIYPAYFVVVIICASIYDIQHPILTRLINLVTHLLLVHNFSEATIYSISIPLWSVATEFQLYLMLPILFILLRRLPARIKKTSYSPLVVFLSGGFVGLGGALLGVMFLRAFSVDPQWIRLGGHVLADLPTFGLLQFAGGVAAGYVYFRASRLRIDRVARVSTLAAWSAIAVIVALGLIVLFPVWFYDVLPFGWPLQPFLYSALVLSVALGRGSLSVTALLESRIPRFIGMISYSFYLFHDLILWMVFGNPSADPAAALNPANYIKAILAFGLTVVVAYISYRFVERRFLEPLIVPKLQPAALPGL